MRVIVTTEHRFDRTPDGVIWTASAFPLSFWSRYLQVFDQVRVVARVRDVLDVPSWFMQCSGRGVHFIGVPYFRGPSEFLRVVGRVLKVTQASVAPDDAVILRVSSTIASCLEPQLQRTRHPYGVEVVGDPWDVFAPGVLRHPLSLGFRWWFTWTLKRQCAQACAAAYVTQSTLQRRYPSAGYQVGVSDVQIPDKVFVAERKVPIRTRPLRGADTSPSQCSQEALSFGMRRCRLITVGSLEQLYKGPDVLLRAIAECVSQELDLELVLVGDGKYRPYLQDLAQKLRVADRVIFRGMLPSGDPVGQELAAADLFILPSRTEGLPRALIEAMAYGLPCIGSTAGGIPELLPSEDMVPPGDSMALAHRIREVVTDAERMEQMSRRNQVKSQEFRPDILQERRNRFYRYIYEATRAYRENGRSGRRGTG